ncbi:type I restriction-modification system subunit M [Bacillus badius]|uniref:type I restriction-modification system subunit M n=1 Tax=Bacillus badius TaxID=1455 RepID=UPI000597721C|nr:type I restriction-modification system subunit M [Bacillus badius]KIL72339.1 Type I restriction-modification system, DNA-methyltransferase subunit M [Bacillus badius]
MLQNNSTLKSKIDQLWNKFWSGGISNPLTAIEQITYLLFMKRMDDLDLKRIADAEFTEEEYVSKFEGEFTLPGTKEKVDKQTLRWSQFKRMPADDMLAHVQLKVFPFLKMLNGDESPFTHYMKNAVFIISKPALLVEAVSIIEEIYTEIEKDANEGGQTFQDIQGDVYELLLSEIASSGKNGQFRTPRHIIKLIAELIEPQLGQRISDPACGTGGFLLGAYQYMVTQLNKNKKELQPDEDGFIRSSVSGLLTRKVSDILNESLYGYDIDVTMVRLALMNLMMHGIETPNVVYKDTLSKGFRENNDYNIIMANPPFTGSIDKGDINESLQLGTTKTELLFMENIYNLLKMGGTAGVIVPQGVLFGSGKAFVEARKILVEKCELKAVITMPSGVFKPYAGVSTAILIFTKGGETENVWFYDMQSDGYSLDDKRTKLEGYGDLQDIVTQYKNRDPQKNSDRKEKFFFVPKKEIVEEKYDLSISKYKEDVYEEVVYEKPELIIAKLKDTENEIQKELIVLEGMLG